MRAFLESTDEAFDALLDAVRAPRIDGTRATTLAGVAHAATGATALMAAAGKGRAYEVCT